MKSEATRPVFITETSEVEAPSGLDRYGLQAWTAAIRSISGTRILSHTDLLSIEAASKAWSRWKAIDEKIAQLSASNILAGEVSKSASGQMQMSPLRFAANEALKEYRDIAKELGFHSPSDREPGFVVDLFGYPDRPGRGQPGRPKFAPTQADRNKVRLLLGLGWGNPRIAAALEVSLPTLHRYFKVELRERDLMRDRLDARRFELAMLEANKGNVTALRELGKLIEKSDLKMLEKRIRDAQDPDQDGEGLPEKLGKKAAAKEAARTAGEGSDWGNDLLPGVMN